MIIESSRQFIESTVVMVSATISVVFSWFPNGQTLGRLDKAISIIAGFVAIVVGLATLYNYARKWTKEGEVNYVFIFQICIVLIVCLGIATAVILS